LVFAEFHRVVRASDKLVVPEGHPTIAHRFNGGNESPTLGKAPPGAKDLCGL
jgi:hypothetical protein